MPRSGSAAALCVALGVVALVLVLLPTRTCERFDAPPAPPERAYVINLDRNHERLATFGERYASSGLPHPLERFPAVDGRALDASDYDAIVHPAARAELDEVLATGKRRRHEQLTPGAVGCYHSHMSCWREAAARGERTVLVFEDDARLAPGVATAMLDTLRAADAAAPDWDVLLFGYETSVPPGAGGVVPVDSFNGTHAYAVRPATALAKFRGRDKAREQLDWALAREARRGPLRVLGAADPNLVPVDWTGTDIQTPFF